MISFHEAHFEIRNLAQTIADESPVASGKRPSANTLEDQPAAKRFRLIDDTWKAAPDIRQMNEATAARIVRLLKLHPDLLQVPSTFNDLSLLTSRIKLTLPSQELSDEWNLFLKLLNRPVVDLEDCEKNIIPCNAALLAYNSTYYNHVLQSVIPEANSKVFKLAHNQAEIATALRFLQTEDEGLITNENGWDLLRLAHYMQSPKLINVCEQTLINYIDNSDLCTTEDLENIIQIFAESVDGSTRALLPYVQKKFSDYFRQIFRENSALPPESFLEVKNKLKQQQLPLLIDWSHSEIFPQDLLLLEGLNIQSLSLENCALPPKTVKILASPSLALASLNLDHNGWVDDALCKTLADRGCLKQIFLNDCPSLTLEGLSALCSLPLERLEVDESAADDTLIQQLMSISSLTHLSLSGCPGITDSSLLHFEKMPQLESLDLSNASITDAAVNFASSNLSTLYLNHCPLSAESIVALSHAKKLKHLYLSGSGLTDPHCNALSKLTALETLDLSGCPNMTENNLVTLLQSIQFKDLALPPLPLSKKLLELLSLQGQLSSLDLTGCTNVDAESLEVLIPLNNLNSLAIKGANITLKECKVLAQMTQLDKLNLDSKKINDACIEVLNENLCLSELTLINANITGSSCKHLGGLGLTHLTLKNCSGFYFFKTKHFEHLRFLTVENSSHIGAIYLNELRDKGVIVSIDG